VLQAVQHGKQALLHCIGLGNLWPACKESTESQASPRPCDAKTTPHTAACQWQHTSVPPILRHISYKV
jgi:hypothetical protein